MNSIEKLIKALPQSVDCALITSDINRRYFTGMKSSAGYLAVFKEKAYLIIDFRYIEKARKTAKSCEVVLLKSLSEQFDELMKKHSAKTIAVEAQTLTISELKSLEKSFPQYDFDTTETLSSVIESIRIVKTAEEIEKITKAQRIAEASFEELLNFIKVGKTEREIALFLDFEMLRRGAEAVSFDTIGLSGANTSLPHGVPSDKVIENGEFVLMDFGAVYDGFHSDMTRTFCVGKPTEEMEKVYSIVLKAQLAGIDFCKSGVSGKDMDAVSRKIIDDAGYGEFFGHSLGHGVGMEIHETPNASPHSAHTLAENMVITVEPGIYLPNKFGVRIEDFVVVKPNGCENITKCDKNLKCL